MSRYPSFAAIALLLAAAKPTNAAGLGFINVTVDLLPTSLTYPLLSSDTPEGTFPNRVGDVLFGLPDGFELRKITPDGTWRTNTWEAGAWSDPGMTLLPGEGALFAAPRATTLTFVGVLPEGVVRTYVPAGRSLVGSPIPQTGKLFTDLGFPLVDGVALSRLDSRGTWQTVGRIAGGQWNGAGPEPVIQVAEAFLVDAPRSFVWERPFQSLPPAPPIVFTKVPRSQDLALGEVLVLEAAIETPAGLAYQWQRNGTNLPGATSPLHVVNRTTADDQGDYWLAVYGPDRLQFSTLARVTIATPPPALREIRTADPARHEITITGTAGALVDLQRSSDLRSWTDLRSALPLPATVSVPRDAARPAEFFRARQH